MDSLETTSHDVNMEATATNEDVLVLLQTESGEQIALPMSALPSDFVPGDSGQIIMVESVDEQQQEVVVESSSTTETQSNIGTLVDTSSILASTAITTNDSSKITTDVLTHQTDIPMLQIQTTNNGDKPVPRTYSKGSVFKSYAPTCGATRIYQQSQLISGNSLNHINSSNVEVHNDEVGSQLKEKIVDATSQGETINIQKNKKQKRKETLLTRPLNEEDMKLEFYIIEDPLPEVQEVEVKRKPRKEYRTKKKLRAMEKLSKEELVDEEISRREERPKRGATKDKPIETPVPIKQEQPQTERRTRLSNTCRVATGKSYKCNDCDFSTDRINNIILHVRENCPKLKKT